MAAAACSNMIDEIHRIVPDGRTLSRIAQLDQRTASRTNVCTRRKRTCGPQGGSPGLYPKGDQTSRIPLPNGPKFTFVNFPRSGLY